MVGFISSRSFTKNLENSTFLTLASPQICVTFQFVNTFLQYFFKGEKNATSNGWQMWILYGGKPRQTFACFISYKKQNELLHAKKNLKGSKNYPKAFLTEDLTPLRSKLLNYVKYECNDKFVLCHSMNGRIRMKKASGRVDKEGKGKKNNVDQQECP